MRRFLKLPAHQDLGLGLHTDSTEFSYGAFRAAMGETDFDAYISLLVTEMLASPEATHAFAPRRMLQAGAEAGLATFIGKELVKGALGEVGGMAMGTALSALGIGGDDSSQQLAEIRKKLLEMQSQLSNLENQTAAIQTELKISQYNSAVNTLAAEITNIKNLTQELGYLINVDPSVSEQDPGWILMRTRFYNSICSIYARGQFGEAGDIFDDILRGNSTGTPAIQLFAESKTKGRVLFNWKDSQDLNGIRLYWESIQAHLFNLIDVYLATGQSEDGCNSTSKSVRLEATPGSGSALQMKREAVAKAFQERQLKQLAMYPPMLLPKDTAVDLQNKTMVRTDLVYRPPLPFPNKYHPSLPIDAYAAYNYAHITMNSADSPLRDGPDYLRQGWRLISRDAAYRLFKDSMDAAIQRGWPETSRFIDSAVMSEDSRTSVRFPDNFTWQVEGWSLHFNDWWWAIDNRHDVITIAVRDLVEEEKYLPPGAGK